MSLNEHWTRKKGKRLPKKAYTSLEDALTFLDENPKLKEKYSPYICSVCEKWHIGHSHIKRN